MRFSSIRHRRRRLKIATMELNLTSLLDVVTTIIAFLLQYYGSAGYLSNIPSDLHLPKSQSNAYSTEGVMVKVTPEKIWVENKEVLNFAETSVDAYDQSGKRIIPLYDQLISLKESYEMGKKMAFDPRKGSLMINLLVDKTIKYDFLKKILHTCGDAGFVQFKFVVAGEKNRF